ncbi:MAG TPA: ABC transporter substrate-binding protein [Rhizobiaceae bacterium]
MKLSRNWAGRLLAATVLLAAPALSPSWAQDAKPIVIASSEDVISLDPHMLDSNNPTGSVIWSVFDSLVRRDLDGSPQPRLATSWERVDDVTWRFKLREGVKFTNGEPFNAEAVKINFARMDTAPFNSVQQLHDQTGLKEVRVVDDYTIELVTAAPTVNMLYWLEEAFIAAPKYITETSPDEVAKAPIGSGPYKFVDWRRGDALVLTRNDDYWGEKPAVKDVVFRNIPEVSSRLNELRAGTVDLVIGITPDSADQANSDVSDLVKIEGLRKMHMGISIKGEQPALADARVRQALNHAVDVPTIISSLLGGSTSSLLSVVNPPNNNPALTPFAYDPEKAKALLAEAGYADGFPLTLQWSTRFDGGKEVSEVVGSFLEQVGIKPTYEAVELGQFREGLSKASLKGIYFQGWAALINPSVELVILTCGHVDNSSGYCNPKYDELVLKASQTLDDAERQTLEFQAQEIIWNDAPWLYLWRLPSFFGLSKQLSYEFRADNYLEPYLITYK